MGGLEGVRAGLGGWEAGPEATPEASRPEADLVQAGGLSPYKEAAAAPPE